MMGGMIPFIFAFVATTRDVMRKYKVVLDYEVSCTYLIKAKDDADLLNLWKTGELEEKAEIIKKDTTKTIMNNWKQIKDV